MRTCRSLSVTLALVAAAAARADTIDVDSTTLLNAAKQTRGGTPGQPFSLDTAAPAFEILSITVRDVRNGFADDLTFVLKTWASYDIADRRWDNGTDSSLTGDVSAGYVQGRFIGRRLTLRLGREVVATGVARTLQLDGGDAVLTLPAGFKVSGYVGAPVTQRFGSRTAMVSWNPVGGDLAYGGRVAWAYGFAGYPGRGIEIGASANLVEDGGDPVREEVGADLRLQPFRDLTFTGLAAYSLYDERPSELLARVSYSITHALRLDADAQYTAPDLFLARNSILSVFSAEDRTDFGGALTWEVRRGISVGAGYHLVTEPGEEEGKTFDGSEAAAHVEWEREGALAGAEFEYLDAFENGYTALRVFGRRDFGRFFGTADVMGHLFKHAVNGQDYAVTGTLGAGLELAKGFSAVISGNAGVTPFLEQTYSLMAKLVYTATYRAREVR